MSTEKNVTREKSPSRELLTVLLSSHNPHVPLLEIKEIDRILELDRELKPKKEEMEFRQPCPEV